MPNKADVLIKASGFAISLILAGGSGHAALTQIDDPAFGQNSIVFDDNTGLEWLNVRFSVRMSPSQVNAEFQAAGKFDGWGYASENQYVSLVTEFFGGDPGQNNSGLDLATTENFINLFGPTATFASLPAILGYYGVIDPGLGRSLEGCVGEFRAVGDGNGQLSGYSSRECLIDLASDGVGSYLVRDASPATASLLAPVATPVPTPEPGTVPLLLTACLGLWLSGRALRTGINSPAL